MRAPRSCAVRFADQTESREVKAICRCFCEGSQLFSARAKKRSLEDLVPVLLLSDYHSSQVALALSGAVSLSLRAEIIALFSSARGRDSIEK